MHRFLKWIGIITSITVLAVCFFLFRIYSLQSVAHQLTEELFTSLQANDATSVTPLLSPELLTAYPDVISQLQFLALTVDTVKAPSEWFIGGYVIGTGGEKYTYHFDVVYTDSTTGSGDAKFIRKSFGGQWQLYAIDITPDTE